MPSLNSPLALLSAALFLAASALGQAAIVNNNCGFPIYLDSIKSDGTSSGVTFVDAYGSWNEGMPPDIPTSIQLGTDSGISSPLTFEYNLSGTELYFDISQINGNPFASYGLSLNEPTDSSCGSVYCGAPSAGCTATYLTPSDSSATLACSANDLLMTLCA